MRKDVNDMFEIKGKVTTAICYAKVIEDEAIEQIRNLQILSQMNDYLLSNCFLWCNID